MADITHDDAALRRLLQKPRRIAVVGASPDPGRDSNGVFRVLLDAGHDVVPVNPVAEEVHGVKAVADLPSAARRWRDPVEVVVVFRAPEHAAAVADAAVAVGARTVWFQLGVASEEAVQRASEAGLDVVVDRCVKVESARLAG